MLEVRVEFRSQDQWQTWYDTHHMEFAGWRDTVLQAIRHDGLREPISGDRRAPGDLSIDNGNLRESIAAFGLNSRKRAGLCCLEILRGSYADQGCEPHILGTELMSRVGLLLSENANYACATDVGSGAARLAGTAPPNTPGYKPLAAASFDLFHGGDLLEQMTDPTPALAEVTRLLRPGGAVVTTLRFSPFPELAEPGPRQWIGWEILDLCRAAGLDDPQIVYILSSRHGISDSKFGGVFVLCASKHVTRPAPTLAFNYDGPVLDQVIGLLALPRSGTTLLTSMMSVHSAIRAVYEPWNANKKTVNISDKVALNEFFKIFRANMEGKPTLFVKETATDGKYISRIVDLLNSVAQPLSRELVWLVRDPIHVFLSEVDARRAWWGDPDLALGTDVFDKWAARTLDGVRALLAATLHFNGILVSYDTLVAQPRLTLQRLMDALGLRLEEKQLEFQSHVKLADVRGDNNIAKDPQKVSTASVELRTEQEATIADILRMAKRGPVIGRLQQHFAKIDTFGVLRAADPAARAWIAVITADIAR